MEEKQVRPPVMPREAGEWLALIIKASRSSHRCIWCDYFRRAAERLEREYLPSEERGEEERPVRRRPARR